MKAIITLGGKLSIIPESDIERYALRKWWQDYEQGQHESSIEALFLPDSDHTSDTHD